jgi:hypothetical protein
MAGSMTGNAELHSATDAECNSAFPTTKQQAIKACCFVIPWCNHDDTDGFAIVAPSESRTLSIILNAKVKTIPLSDFI